MNRSEKPLVTNGSNTGIITAEPIPTPDCQGHPPNNQTGTAGQEVSVTPAAREVEDVCHVPFNKWPRLV